MKRTSILISCLIMAIGTITAQSIAEIFKGDDFLTSVFVSPLGIHDLPDQADAISVENQIKASGNGYKSIYLGPFGDVFTIIPSDMAIGDTPIAGLTVCVNKDSTMLLYQSEASGAYRSMYATLDKALRQYAVNTETSDTGSTHFSIYMLTEEYGIAVGTDDRRQTTIACLLDIRNLLDFLGLGSLQETDVPR